MADLKSRQFDTNAKNPLGKRILIIGLIFAIIMAIGYGISTLIDTKPVKAKRKITKIKLKAPPPPPPPPPPKEQPKQVKKQEKKQVKKTPPKPKPAPEPQEQLKMEGPAGDGPSPFAAGEVTNEYQSGDLRTKIGGVSKAKFRWYTNKVSNEILEAIQSDEQLKYDKFELRLKVWLKHNGKIERFKVLRTTGSAERDRLIESVLNDLTSVSAPPSGLGKPVMTLKIKGRPLM